MNRYQALALFTDWAFEEQLGTGEIYDYLNRYAFNYEQLGRLIAARILDAQDRMPRELVLKAEDLTFVPAHF